MIVSPSHPAGFGRRTGHGVLLRCSVVAAAAVMALSACSSGDDRAPQASATPANRICDGALDASAQAALKRLGGSDTFKELTGKTSAGQPNQFSLSRAAAHLHDEVELRSRCTVYLPDDTSGAPLVQLDFETSNKPPIRAEVEKQEPNARLTFYPLGVYAATSDDNSTSLYFTCTTKGADGEASYVDGGIFSSGDQLKGNSTSKDRMTILNSVSRRLAEELGCASEANLPSAVPDGETVTS